MKKIFLSLAMLFLFTGVGAVSASAQVTDIIEATIPFDFTVQDTRLPAGFYSIKRVSSDKPITMVLRDERGHNLLLFLTNAAYFKGSHYFKGRHDEREPDDSYLIFNRIGDRYFLSEIFEEGSQLGVALVKSDLEKRLDRELSIVHNRIVIVSAQTR